MINFSLLQTAEKIRAILSSPGWNVYTYHDAVRDETCSGLIMTLKAKIERDFTLISPKPGAKDQRWSCTLPAAYNDNGRRVQFRGPTKEAVVEKIAKYLVERKRQGGKTINLIYEEWLAWKAAMDGNCPETVKLYRACYVKYIKGHPIADKPMAAITEEDIQDWGSGILSTYNLTAKQFGTVKINMGGVFRYAVKRKYIPVNIWKNGEYYWKCRTEQRKATQDVIFSDAEIRVLFAELRRGYALNGNTANIALMINFDLGLREGEIVALKWADIDFGGKTVMIRRMENSSREVVDRVKSDSKSGYRELPLSDMAITLLRKLRADAKIIPGCDSYVFISLSGDRLTKIEYARRLEKAEMHCNFAKMKRTHCIRRTFASRLIANGVPETTVQTLMGHTSLATTHKYCYDILSQGEKRRAVNENSILAQTVG